MTTKFKVGDTVHGTYRTYRLSGELKGIEFYSGEINTDYEGEAMEVKLIDGSNLLVEFYNGDTMELGDWSPLEKALYNLK